MFYDVNIACYHSTLPRVSLLSILVRGHGNTIATPSLPLLKVLYVPKFPSNLSSITAIHYALLYSIKFFLFYFTFWDLRNGWRIGLSHENSRGIHNLIFYKPSLGLWALILASTSISSLLWHFPLGHPCFEKLQT